MTMMKAHSTIVLPGQISPAEQREILRTGLLNTALKLGRGYAQNGSPYTWMFDTRELLLKHPFLQIIGRMLWERLKPYRPDMVGGMTLAANPLTAAVLYEAWNDGYPLDGFLIRKTRKENGLKKLVEGPDILPGTRVVLVDDMVNSGTTQRQAVKSLAPFQCEILAIGTVLDTERMGGEWLRARSIAVESLYTLKELGVIPRAPSQPNAARLAWRWGPLNSGTHTAPHSTPFVTAERIVVGSDKGQVICLDHAGKELWRFTIRDSRHGIHSSPIVRGERVWVGGYDGFVYCLDVTNGECVWERRVGQWVGSSPTLDSAGERLFIGAEHGESGGSLVALSAVSGDIHWETQVGHYVHSAPFIEAARGRVLVGCNDGNLYSMDAVTGAILWRFNTGAEIKAGPAVDEMGICFTCSLDGSIYAVETEHGTLVWQRQLGRRSYFRPLLCGPHVLAAGSSGRLVAMDRVTGDVRWVAATGAAITGGAALTSDGRIVVGSGDGCIYLLGADTGEILWIIRTGGPITCEPGLRGNLCAVPSRDGFLYGLTLST